MNCKMNTEKRLYVGGIAYATTQQGLADAFAKDNNPDTVTTVNGQRAGN